MEILVAKKTDSSLRFAPFRMTETRFLKIHAEVSSWWSVFSMMEIKIK